MKKSSPSKAPVCLLVVALLGTAAFGCEKKQIVGPGPGPQPPITDTAQRLYDEGLSEIVRLDASNGWTQETCESTARIFLESEEAQNGKFLPAVYNAGVAYHRCQDYEHAEPLYQRVLGADPQQHRARVQLARIALAKSKGSTLKEAIAEFERAIVDSQFNNVEALVELARAQMKRLSSTPDKDGNNDLERARKNLQRALAVDDNYMPAFEQLATNYLMSARGSANVSSVQRVSTEAPTKSNQQLLELALLVASQGLRKNPDYAPLYNIAGVIYVELGDPTTAVRRFGAARKLDGSLFEAHMNFAAVNLSFRGFAEAEGAYRAAIKLSPNDFEAHLGWALALRGNIDKANDQGAAYDESTTHLLKARELDDARPETYFNEAILVAEYGVRVKGMTERAATGKAISLFEQFVARAKENPAFATAVDDVVAVPTWPDEKCFGAASKKHECKRGRIYDLKDALAFAEQNEQEQRRREQEDKAREASQEAI